jgi:hypothetical protein
LLVYLKTKSEGKLMRHKNRVYFSGRPQKQMGPTVQCMQPVHLFSLARMQPLWGNPVFSLVLLPHYQNACIITFTLLPTKNNRKMHASAGAPAPPFAYRSTTELAVKFGVSNPHTTPNAAHAKIATARKS